LALDGPCRADVFLLFLKAGGAARAIKRQLSGNFKKRQVAVGDKLSRDKFVGGQVVAGQVVAGQVCGRQVVAGQVVAGQVAIEPN
jgi:hypothetical protein